MFEWYVGWRGSENGYQKNVEGDWTTCPKHDNDFRFNSRHTWDAYMITVSRLIASFNEHKNIHFGNE